MWEPLAFRGTDFVVRYDPDTSLAEIDLNEGEIDYTPTGSTEATSYEAGQSIAIAADGTISTSALSPGGWRKATADLIYRRLLHRCSGRIIPLVVAICALKFLGVIQGYADGTIGSDILYKSCGVIENSDGRRRC